MIQDSLWTDLHALSGTERFRTPLPHLLAHQIEVVTSPKPFVHITPLKLSLHEWLARRDARHGDLHIIR